MSSFEYFRDILKPGLDIVFCGMAPGNKSAKVGAYYAHKGNRFWRVLKKVGLTDVELRPEEFPRLSEYNIGLTDLFKDQCGMDHTIDVKKFDRALFNSKILEVSPKKLAFTSKNVGSVYFGVGAGKLSFGLQKEKLGDISIYILPGTSPANSGNWSKNPSYIEYWKELKINYKNVCKLVLLITLKAVEFTTVLAGYIFIT